MSAPYFRIRGGCWIARDPAWELPGLEAPQKSDRKVDTQGFRIRLPVRQPRVVTPPFRA